MASTAALRLWWTEAAAGRPAAMPLLLLALLSAHSTPLVHSLPPSPRRLAFFTDLGIRGTAVAMYDYAHYAEVLLRISRPLIIWKSVHFDQHVYDKFEARFARRSLPH